jgi:hypothetical protein
VPGEELIMKDTKAALGTNLKPDITHCRTPFLNYTARASEYGTVKYVRANYVRPTDPLHSGGHTRLDFERLRAYLRAAASHIIKTLDSMEYHQAMDPKLENLSGMVEAAYARDTDEPDESSPVGASNLPHLAGACASLNMAITQAALCGLLPEDPGATWEMREKKKEEKKTWNDGLNFGGGATGGAGVGAGSTTVTLYSSASICKCGHHREVHTDESWNLQCGIATCDCQGFTR